MVNLVGSAQQQLQQQQQQQQPLNKIEWLKFVTFIPASESLIAFLHLYVFFFLLCLCSLRFILLSTIVCNFVNFNNLIRISISFAAIAKPIPHLTHIHTLARTQRVKIMAIEICKCLILCLFYALTKTQFNALMYYIECDLVIQWYNHFEFHFNAHDEIFFFSILNLVCVRVWFWRH